MEKHWKSIAGQVYLAAVLAVWISLIGFLSTSALAAGNVIVGGGEVYAVDKVRTQLICDSLGNNCKNISEGWGASGSGTSFWTGDDTFISYMGGVGIGTNATAGYGLSVNGNVYAGGNFYSAGASSGFVAVDRLGAALGSSVFYRSNNITRLWDSFYGDVISYNAGGNVGIGTTNVTAKLDVNGSINVNGKIKAWMPLDSDPDDTVATKGYVDAACGGGFGENISVNGIFVDGCEVTNDCDGDGHIYFTGDCDESCNTCYFGSTYYSLSDGKDQDCDGVIDEDYKNWIPMLACENGGFAEAVGSCNPTNIQTTCTSVCEAHSLEYDSYQCHNNYGGSGTYGCYLYSHHWYSNGYPESGHYIFTCFCKGLQ